MTDDITQTLLKQLAKQQAELETQQEELNKLTKENEKLKLKGGATNKTRYSGIYEKTRKNGKKVYGFTIRDENYKKIRRENFSTITEAAAAKRELLNLRDEYKLATFTANQKQTFSDFCEVYLKKAESEFAINTYEAADGIIKNHLDYFQNILITKCTKQKAQEWSEITRPKMINTPSAFNNTLKLAKAIWNNAIKKDLTNLENPFKSINPINIKKECETREEIRIDKQQADVLLKTANSIYSDYTYPIIATALYAGLREGETLGLMWPDIDFKNNTIFIQRQAQRVTKKRMKILLKKRPELTEKEHKLTCRLKTESSKAKIAVPQILIDILKEYKKALMASGNLQELCFCDSEGMPLTARDFVRYKFQNVLNAAFGDKMFMHFHELRGSCATILHLEGVPDKIIQGILRHQKLSMTQDVYMKVNVKNKETSKQLDKAFA